MRNRISRLCLSIGLFGLIATEFGCASIMNPYESEFKCGKGTPFGKCASTPEIYAEEVPGYRPPLVQGSSSPHDKKCKDCGENGKPRILQARGADIQQPPSESAYREAELAKITKLLKAPVTPVVVPPSVMRILFTPVQGEVGELNMPQYVFLMMDRPKWVMGDYLAAQPMER